MCYIIFTLQIGRTHTGLAPQKLCEGEQAGACTEPAEASVFIFNLCHDRNYSGMRYPKHLRLLFIIGEGNLARCAAIKHKAGT